MAAPDIGWLVVVFLFIWPLLLALLGVVVGAFRRDRETLLTWTGPFTFYVLPLLILGSVFVLNEATDLRYATVLIVASVAAWGASIWIVVGYLAPLWEDQVERDRIEERAQEEERKRQLESDLAYQERNAQQLEKKGAFERTWQKRLSRRPEAETPEEQGQRLVESEVARVEWALSQDPPDGGTIVIVVAHGRLPWDWMERLAGHENPLIRSAVAGNLRLRPPTRYSAAWEQTEQAPKRALAIFSKLANDPDIRVLEAAERNYERFTTELRHEFRRSGLGHPPIPRRPLHGEPT